MEIAIKTEEYLEKFSLLPLELQKQVLDFINFLLWKHYQQEEQKPEEYDELLKELLLKRSAYSKEHPESRKTWDEVKNNLFEKYQWQITK
ncbi:MAG: hypothetical protein MUE81_23995 [Thermoflexibacter sp.]|jgi:hypothetical protein|nr:hypothetical protein [Thermoflexibacter sp.]